MRLIISQILFFACVVFSIISNAQQPVCLVSNIISNTAERENDFPLVKVDKSVAAIRYDEADYKGVIRAITDLKNDIYSVTGAKPKLLTSEAFSDFEIIVGTIGKSKLVGKSMLF